MKNANFLIISLALTSFSPLLLSSCNQKDSPPPAVAPETSGKVTIVDPTSAAKAIEEKKDLVILDIRTPEEFAEGHLKGAVNIDFLAPDFKEKVAKLDPTKPVLLHCQSGRRSTQALPILESTDLDKIYHLDSGFKSWEDAGQPVEK